MNEIGKRISERMLKGRDEGKNVVEECEERMRLVCLLWCEYFLSYGAKEKKFVRDVVFPLSTSLLDIRHYTPQSDETDLFLPPLVSLLSTYCRDSTYGSWRCSEKG
jgi:hypothetical protein